MNKNIVYDGVATIPQEIANKLRTKVRSRTPIDMFEYKKKKEEQSRKKVIDKLIDYSKSLDW